MKRDVLKACNWLLNADRPDATYPVYVHKKETNMKALWKSATRGDALKALANGVQVERRLMECCPWRPMRWTERGAEWQATMSWSLESYHPDSVYRVLDARPRRTFLDRWVEVDTLEEAEPARGYNTENPQALFVVDGKYLERGHAELVLSADSYWVARK